MLENSEFRKRSNGEGCVGPVFRCRNPGVGKYVSGKCSCLGKDTVFVTDDQKIMVPQTLIVYEVSPEERALPRWGPTATSLPSSNRRYKYVGCHSQPSCEQRKNPGACLRNCNNRVVCYVVQNSLLWKTRAENCYKRAAQPL